MDRSRFRKKVALNLLGAPSTLIPAAAGLSGLLIGWALGPGTEWLAFGGIAAVLVGLGTLVTRWLFGSDELARRALEEMEAESQAERRARLDDLDRRLQEDADPRTERSLRELRRLYEAFKGASLAKEAGMRAAFEVADKVEKLFRGCIMSLERSLEIWKTASRMESASGRERLLESRDAILDEVQKSVEQLSRTVDDLHSLAVGSHDTSELSRVRRELDESLDVARRVEERMRSLEGEIVGDERRRE